jgi:hypothetical protein
MNSKKMKGIFFILAVGIAFSVHAQNCCTFELAKGASVKQISKKYKQLKKLQNQDCCKNYGSGLMTVMGVLKDRIHLRTTENRIIEIMGQPDMYATKEHPVEYQFTKLEKNQKVLIYHWRGMHDFLYFVLQDNHLITKNWYFALE